MYILLKHTQKFSRIDHISGYKTSSNKFRIEIIPNIFSNDDSTKLKINNRKIGKFTNMCKLNNILTIE